ncbi:MAG TPA: ABC transporter substrate-binding protein [Rhodanobacteraceae bacterium]
MLKRALLLLVAALFTGAMAAPALAATGQTPQQVVQAIADELGTEVQGHQAELRQHPEQMVGIIDKVLLPHFDLNYSALLVLGRYARQATPAQRVAFTRAFYDALMQRYASALIGFTRGAVKVLPSDAPLDQQRTLVRTQMTLNNGKSLSVDYAFHKTQSGQWKAYDVLIEGISYVTVYRSQVAGEIQKEGIEGLIKQLQSQGAGAINQMKQGGKG